MQSKAQEINPGSGQNNQQRRACLTGDEQYALSLLKVRSLTEYDTVTEVLRTWEWIREMSVCTKKPAEKTATATSKTTNGSDTRT